MDDQGASTQALAPCLLLTKSDRAGEVPPRDSIGHRPTPGPTMQLAIGTGEFDREEAGTARYS